jgi:hypothetical protein
MSGWPITLGYWHATENMQVIFEIILQVIFTAVFKKLHGSTATYKHATTTHTLYMMLI